MNLSSEFTFPNPSRDTHIPIPGVRTEYTALPGVRTKLKFGVDQILAGIQENSPCDLRNKTYIKNI